MQYNENTLIIDYDNSYSTCQSFKYYKDLDKLLSVESKNSFWIRKYSPSGWDGKYHFFNVRSGKFPSGLLGIVHNFCKVNNISIYVIGNIPKKIEYKGLEIRGFGLRDYQKETVEKALIKRRGILYQATNSGKTGNCCAILKEINLPTLILVHNKILFSNFYNRVKLHLPEFSLSGINEDHNENLNAKIIIAMVGSLFSRLKNDIYLEWLRTRIKILVIEECHSASSTRMFKIAINCNAPYRFGLSGTPFKDNDLDDMRLRAVTGNVISRVSNDYLIKQGYSAVPEIRYITNNSILPKKCYSYPEFYREGIVNNTERNLKIMSICKNHKKNILILVCEIEHGNWLLRLLKTNNFNVKFIHGESDDRDNIIKDFDNEKIDILIASTILDEGADIKNIRVLVLGGGKYSRVRLLQRIGRGLRKKDNDNTLIVYDFMDKLRYLKKHSEIRKSIFIQEGFKVIEDYKLIG